MSYATGADALIVADAGDPASLQAMVEQTRSVLTTVGPYQLYGEPLVAACVNGVFGFLVAWVLVRYDFPGRRIVDALIDLPFALPTAVAGITLTALYAPNGWLGRPLAERGIKVAFTPLGITIALIFIGLPFINAEKFDDA